MKFLDKMKFGSFSSPLGSFTILALNLNVHLCSRQQLKRLSTSVNYTYEFFSALILSCKYVELFKEINIQYKLRSSASACCFKLVSSLAVHLLSSCTTGLEMEKMQ